MGGQLYGQVLAEFSCCYALLYNLVQNADFFFLGYTFGHQDNEKVLNVGEFNALDLICEEKSFYLVYECLLIFEVLIRNPVKFSWQRSTSFRVVLELLQDLKLTEDLSYV